MTTFIAALREPLESEIQSGIRSTLHTLGFWTWNLSQGRPTRQSPGLFDVLAIGRGVVAFVEVKRRKTKQTTEQRRLQAHVDATKGTCVYVVLRSSEEAVRWVQSLPRKGGM